MLGAWQIVLPCAFHHLSLSSHLLGPRLFFSPSDVLYARFRLAGKERFAPAEPFCRT
jgi:hypothetical protein